MFSQTTLLSLIIFLPTIGAVLLLLLQRMFLRSDTSMKWFTLGITVLTFAMAIALAARVNFSEDGSGIQAGMQSVISVPWITSLNIDYALGVDGISLPLVLLTTLVAVLAMGASWNITKNVKAYCILYLLLQTGILGVFLSLDFFLFYIFWELMLLPMYFLIGLWGGPRRMYAALKFFLFTLTGGVLMLVGMLMLYFNSDIRNIANRGLTVGDLQRMHVVSPDLQGEQLDAQLERLGYYGDQPVHTFNILALQQLGQQNQFSEKDLWGKSIGYWAFLLLFVGFLVKVPAVPIHTWLPDAHVEAPTPISMILAGVLLKLGGYGIIRICYPICPDGAFDLQWLVCSLGLLSMVYGAFGAMAAKDFKRLVAYSSVSHMGYVVLGIGAWSATAGSWGWGVNGAMFQMIAHGISSTGMFFMVGIIYDRVHHRNLDDFGGIFSKMPVYGGIAFGIFFAGLGLPGLCGFIGEVMVVFSLWQYNVALAIISAAVVLLTAGYILWTLQRVYLGSDYHGPHGEQITRITPRELSIGAPILALAIIFGIFPQTVFRYMEPSVDKSVNELVIWANDNRPIQKQHQENQQPDQEVIGLAAPSSDSFDPAG